MRSVQKALLYALLEPESLRNLQNERKVHRTYGSTGRIKDYAIWRYMAGIS